MLRFVTAVKVVVCLPSRYPVRKGEQDEKPALMFLVSSAKNKERAQKNHVTHLGDRHDDFKSFDIYLRSLPLSTTV
jgi:hypothetical protein